ncbi:MAG: penicillin-binding protein, partial [Coprobacter sp.]|nr:penicillin-binding protein [Coprobacter sp.]
MNKGLQKKANLSGIRKKIACGLWILFGAGVIAVVLLFLFIAYGWIGYMPPIEDLENPKDKFASEIYSSDMEVLGRYYQSKANRVYVHYKELS